MQVQRAVVSESWLLFFLTDTLIQLYVQGMRGWRWEDVQSQRGGLDGQSEE